MKRKSIVTELRKAIEDSDYSQKELVELSGVNRTQLYRFVNDKRSLSLETASKLCEVLGLELTQKQIKIKDASKTM